MTSAWAVGKYAKKSIEDPVFQFYSKGQRHPRGNIDMMSLFTVFRLKSNDSMQAREEFGPWKL